MQETGVLSIKKIRDFASEVKSATSGTAFPELSQVIPRQYLETTVENEVFQYNGEEYGFYMVKEGEYFDLLLIDFVYEFQDNEDHEYEYIIQVKPILQQSFAREMVDGNYTWKKTSVERNKYYVAQPRFLTRVLNENDLNYGDIGYNKLNDSGMIIRQSRTNYAQLLYKTESDLIEECARFAGEQCFNALLDQMDALGQAMRVGNIGTMAGLVVDTIEFATNLNNQAKETVISVGNEANILTNTTKENQENNSSIESYTRFAAFAPTDEIILSDDINSYAEFIVVLEGRDSASRLGQLCDFNIVKRDSEWSSMRYVTETKDSVEQLKTFSFYKEEVLFNDIVEEASGNELFYYVLPNGTHKFSFVPLYSGNFILKSNQVDVQISVNATEYQSEEVDIFLKQGEKYIVSFSTNNKTYAVGTIELQDIDGIKLSLEKGMNYIGKYTPSESGV
ncbi:MAG: hypothetical protein IJX98_05800 [Clostridia bacterium]|nr:hypothetical protein [Clostridia bacterium]